MKKTVLLVSLFCLFFACRKKQDAFVPDSFCQDGYIRWGGSPAADGLGWYYAANLDRTWVYVLKDLPDNFKTDSLAVSVCLEKTRELMACNCSEPFPYYKVNSIRLR
jgi:hypothetical protein